MSAFCLSRVHQGRRPHVVESRRGSFNSMGLKHKIATLAGRIGEHFSKGDTYDRAKLHRRLNRIYESPPIAVDPTRPATINVLVPKVHFPSMSAGFFGVFQTAHFLR